MRPANNVRKCTYRRRSAPSEQCQKTYLLSEMCAQQTTSKKYPPSDMCAQQTTSENIPTLGHVRPANNVRKPLDICTQQTTSENVTTFGHVRPANDVRNHTHLWTCTPSKQRQKTYLRLDICALQTTSENVYLRANNVRKRTYCRRCPPSKQRQKSTTLGHVRPANNVRKRTYLRTFGPANDVKKSYLRIYALSENSDQIIASGVYMSALIGEISSKLPMIFSFCFLQPSYYKLCLKCAK